MFWEQFWEDSWYVVKSSDVIIRHTYVRALYYTALSKVSGAFEMIQWSLSWEVPSNEINSVCKQLLRQTMLPCYTTPNTHVSVMHKDDNSSLALKVFSKYFTHHVMYPSKLWVNNLTLGCSVRTSAQWPQSTNRDYSTAVRVKSFGWTKNCSQICIRFSGRLWATDELSKEKYIVPCHELFR